MNTEKRSKPIRRKAVQAVASFVALIHANERGESHKVEVAQTELKRLGVRVEFAKAVYR